MAKKGERIEVDITDTGDGMRCFGKMPEGLAVFVEGPVAVGDRVEAIVVKVKRNYLEARLTRVISTAPVRVKPPCAHFGVCGGCKWQHVLYEEQLRIKRKLVADALQHIGGFHALTVAETLPSPQIFGYRNKIEFSFGDRRFLPPDEMAGGVPTKPTDFALGFHAPGRFDKVVDIDRCHLATDEMNEALALVKAFARERGLTIYNTRTHEGFLRNLTMRKGFGTGDLMVYLVTSAYDADLMRALDDRLVGLFGDRLTTFVNGITTRRNTVAKGDEDIAIRGPGSIRERLGPFSFAISPTSFFQTNTLQAERLYDLALELAELKGDEVVHDLYCGTGTIALWFARRAKWVIGCEVEPSAVRDAETNARENGVENVRFIQLDLAHYDEAVRCWPTEWKPDVVVVDPPRAGLHPDLIAELAGLGPRRIIYISCNPAALARDLKALCAGGRFRPGVVRPVDLFPQTAHVESVVRLDLG